jgi:dihydrofolate reductase
MRHWTSALEKPESPEYSLAKMMVDYPKIVFTKTLDLSPWPNTVLAKGDIVDEVNRDKNKEGKDLLVYGGAGFVSSLIKHNLIDEYYLFVNPVALGKGMTIFKEFARKFELTALFSCVIGASTTQCRHQRKAATSRRTP